MLKIKVHIYDKTQDKIVPHICSMDCVIVRDNAVFVNITQPNKTGIHSFELPKNESVNLLTFLKL